MGTVAGHSQPIFDPLEVPVKLRVSAAAARHLKNLGIETVGDALSYAPRRYFHWGRLTNLSDLPEGEDVTVLARVTSVRMVRNRSGSGVRLLVTVTDGTAQVTCTFFAKKEYAFSRHRKVLQEGEVFLFGGKVSYYQGFPQLVQPAFEEVDSDSTEASERRRGRPIPVYPAKASLPSWKIAALLSQILGAVNWNAVEEVVPEDLRRSQSLLPIREAYRLLHQPADDIDWQNARRTLAWAEALTLQISLLQPRFEAKKEGKGLAVPLRPNKTSPYAGQLLDQLPFDLTDGQKETWATVAQDLDSTTAMQRLLQADVGAGKTVIAVLAMLRAVEADRQAVLLAPTEVLATQHFLSIQRMLGSLNEKIPLHLLTGSQKSGIRREVLTRMAAGEAGITVGTHALLQEGVQVPRLAVLVVDEQHRFGVRQREILREGKDTSPHLLVMTATPIPRTIAMTTFGDLDVSVMKDMPPGRRPVKTFSFPEGNHTWMGRMWQRAREEIDQGGRVYVVCPRIVADPGPAGGKGLPSVEAALAQLQNEDALRGIPLAVAHGQAPWEENAAALERFANGSSPILLSTSMVEVGVDVPEATMMIILGAQQFGLSQLHQLRGRVGRSNRPSVCMLVHSDELSAVGQQRLQALVENSDGFMIAETDLNLRREGDVLGGRQSGGSSSLRFLSVRSDASVIAAARAESMKVLGRDPSLTDLPGLRQAVQRRVTDELVWLERS